MRFTWGSVIWVYNRAIQVVACLDRLLRLDLEDFELVLVDDASTGKTRAARSSRWL